MRIPSTKCLRGTPSAEYNHNYVFTLAKDLQTQKCFLSALCMPSNHLKHTFVSSKRFLASPKDC